MVTWHLTMKLFSVKCHERATLRKLWRQTGNSSLLPAKCDRWNLRAVFRFCYCFVLLYNKSLNDWSLGEQWILFPSTSSRETLRFSILGKQNSLFPPGPVVKYFSSDVAYSSEKSFREIDLQLVSQKKHVYLHNAMKTHFCAITIST